MKNLLCPHSKSASLNRWNPWLVRGLTWFVLMAIASTLASSHAAALDPSVGSFVKRYCLDCHDAETEKGDRNFERFVQTANPEEHLLELRDMLDQLNLGEMPPKKKATPQPEDNERQAVIGELTKFLLSVDQSAKPNHTVMRRLTRYEYNLTMRDLLGVDTAAVDKTGLFPAEVRSGGFANLAEAQALSGHQLDLYMETARAYLDRTLVFGREKPVSRKWVFHPFDLNGQKKNPGSVRYRVWAKDGSYLDIAHGQPVDNGPTYPRRFSQKGVPVDGRYRVRVKATAIGREHPYDPSIFPNDLSVPLQLGLWHVPDASFLGKRASEGRVLIGIYDLPDNEVTEIEAELWMPAGSSPYIHWINGPGSSKRPMRLLTERYHPEALRKSQTNIDRLTEQGLPVPEDALQQKVFISDVYQGPRIRVYEMSLEGPLLDEWPPAGHRGIIGMTTDANQVDIDDLLTRFASKAFRRPVARNEISHYIDYVRNQMADGVSAESAIKLGLAAILTSPRFLFLDEGDSERSDQLDAWQLATRLSYALWSSMPDGRLTELAGSAELLEESRFAAEIDRLMDDPKSSAFVEHFTDAWLHLYQLGSMPPGDKQFPSYYRDRLESAMKTETRMFVADALRHNYPVPYLLSARETFLNGNLAKHYGVDGVVGNAFRKVRFSDKIQRAGLLGHASVLTATANGVETSPVLRGVWVLENILGTPPSPPPPDVPLIESDTRGAVTIREQLAKHRNVSACADCHAKIDPWGFALEFYDPIGGFRTHYARVGTEGLGSSQPGVAIDGSGKLPSGQWIRDINDLRVELLRREHQFTRNLVVKFLTYATGRELNLHDSEEVNRILQDLTESNGGFRDLVHACLESKLFRVR